MELCDYDIGPKIGGQYTSEIYIGIHKETKEVIVIKKESTKVEIPHLHIEAKYLNILQGGIGFPNVYGFHRNEDYKILMMSLHGPSLEQLLNSCNRKFSLKTVLMLADQLIDRIEFIHSKFFLHRNLGPDNLLMGLNEHKHLVYIIDFGRAKRYRTATEVHYPLRERKRERPAGTMVQFASLNFHLNIEQSRKDDLESLGYILMYFLRGSLPWGLLYAEIVKGLAGNTLLKKSPYIKELCKGYPSEFNLYFDHCRSLAYDEEPDYAFLKRVFRELFIREGFHMDYVFDWDVQQEQGQESLQQVEKELGNQGETKPREEAREELVAPN